jgi:hypothetical protein
MRLLASATLAAVLIVAACGGPEDHAASEDTAIDASTALGALFDDYFERNLELNPLTATFIGDYRYNDRLANTFGPEYRAAATAMDDEFLRRLLEIDREQLDSQDRLSYDVFKLNREQSLEGNQFPSHLLPINQFYSLTSSFVQLGSGLRRFSESRGPVRHQCRSGHYEHAGGYAPGHCATSDPDGKIVAAARIAAGRGSEGQRFLCADPQYAR